MQIRSQSLLLLHVIHFNFRGNPSALGDLSESEEDEIMASMESLVAGTRARQHMEWILFKHLSLLFTHAVQRLQMGKWRQTQSNSQCNGVVSVCEFENRL